MSIIQQLEDLKEWSKDSTRYERRLAWRSQYAPGSMGTEAGTIPIEWDELSDREVEYYRTGPWSTRPEYQKGQLVQPGPGRQGYQGEPKDFLKLAPPKSTTKTIPAATTKGRIDEALKGDKFKGLRNLLKGELWFAGADFINNLTKGQSIEKAFKKAVETASFDIKDLDADERALIKHAKEQGASEEEISALRNYLNYMKKYKTYERANKMLDYAKKNLGEGTGSPEDIGTTWEDVTSARENLKLREGELENLYNIYTEGTGDMQLGSNMLDKYMKTLAAEEWNKTAGTLIDRGSRTNQGEGLVWNPIGALTRDIGGLFSGKMPTEFYEATIGKFPSLLDPRIKEKEKQIRIMERPAVGTDYPEYNMAMEDMRYDLGYALPENYAGGGIAGIRRPGYSGGALVKNILKFLKKSGKKKDLYKHIDMEKLMKEKDKIKVYSGTMDRPSNTWKSFKESAKDFGVTPEKYAKDQFKDQWFTPYKSYADSFSSPKYLESKLRSVDLTPKEIAIAKRYVEKINKKDMLVSMRRKLDIKPYPKHSVTTDENLVLIPRYKLKELEKTKRMKTDYMILEKLKKKIGLAEGGLTNIRRPWAIPPESGPDPQGLASLNNYATKRTG